MENSRLAFRTATPADLPRILQIIRQAQAQMRALGSAQWQDGYPSEVHIAEDIARGWGRVLCPAEAGGGLAGTGVLAETGAFGEREETRPETKTDKVPGVRADGVPGARADGVPEAQADGVPEAQADGVPEAQADGVPEAQAAAAYGAVVFDGEPAYAGIEGAWLTEGRYVVLHRLAVADGWKRCGVAREFMLRTEALARGRGVGSFRIDTNFDNRYMLRLVEGLGFVFCGKIRYASGERLAFEKRL